MATVVVGFFRRLVLGVALLLLVVIVSGRRSDSHHRVIRDNSDGDDDFNALYTGGGRWKTGRERSDDQLDNEADHPFLCGCY